MVFSLIVESIIISERLVRFLDVLAFILSDFVVKAYASVGLPELFSSFLQQILALRRRYVSEFFLTKLDRICILC